MVFVLLIITHHYSLDFYLGGEITENMGHSVPKQHGATWQNEAPCGSCDDDEWNMVSQSPYPSHSTPPNTTSKLSLTLDRTSTPENSREIRFA